MKALLTSFCSLAMLLASLLFQSPAMAFSTDSPQSHLNLRDQSVQFAADAKDSDDKLQSAIGSVTGEESQSTKKGDKMAQADAKEVDQITKDLVSKDTKRVEETAK